MTKVYFSKNIKRILEKVDLSQLKEKVGIKTHFGEEGCETYLDPALAKEIYQELKKEGKDSALIECNTLYKGSRTKKESHIKTAKKHGFGFAPINILDGELGEESIKLPVEDGIVKVAKVGGGLKKYNSLIALSHFKGHDLTGYGGAFKNIGMGLGSRAGKLHMHAGVEPNVNKPECIGCGTCVENCPADAIGLVDNKAVIDGEKCIGCAMCIAVCPTGAIKIPEGVSTPEELQKKIVDYAGAIMKSMKGIIFINVLRNITKKCDCVGAPQKPITEDIGILLSKDPVAIDQASLDLVNRNSNGEFGRRTGADKSIQVDYAARKGLGSKDYDLIRLD